MQIAMIGSRGLFSNYGGVERCLDQLCPHLVRLGHQVDVFAQDPCAPGDSVQLRNIPTGSIGGKHLSNLSRSALATLRALRRYDVLHFHATGPAILTTAAAVAGQPCVATIHALDQKREKWGPVARQALGLSERVVVHSAGDITVVSDSLRKYFRERFNRPVTYIPNGVAPALRVQAGALLQQHRLERARYMLFAGRLTPEKGCHDLIRAFQATRSPLKLAIAGGHGSPAYIEQLRAAADPHRVVFLGHLHGPALAEVFSNAHSFALPSYIEGMSLSLLEAIAYGLPVLASDIPENRVVCGNAPLYFKPGDLGGLARAIAALAGGELPGAHYRVPADRLIGWRRVARQYLEVYESVIERSHLGRHVGQHAA